MQQAILSTPPAEVNITKKLVHQLLESQHPDLANLPLQLVESGWDNDIYRLGKDYAVRLPHRQIAVQLLKNEQTWLPILANRLPIPTPVTLRIGQPEFDYPWTWSILPWIAGKAADLAAPHADQAIPLAKFLKALHQPAPPNAPINLSRCVPIQDRAKGVEERLNRLKKKTNLITPTIENIWAAALKADRATEKRWIHADLHARNVVVQDGKISGIIDWGDLTSGDIATDLACIWMLLGDAQARTTALEYYQPSAATLARAKGWTIFFGAVLLDTGLVDNPRHAAMGKLTLERLVQK